MVSLKIDVALIRNGQLVRCYSILPIQHQYFDNYRTPLSETGIIGGGDPTVISRYIRAPKTNVSYRQDVSLSNDLDVLNLFSSGDKGF